MVLGKDPDACVAVWTARDPRADHRARAARARTRWAPSTSKLQRFFQANSFAIELDAAGRVTLPPPLLEHAAIEKDVVVAGVGDHLEVWSPRALGARAAGELDAGIEEVTEAPWRSFLT